MLHLFHKSSKAKQLGLLPKLVGGILTGILLGLIGPVFQLTNNILFVGMVRLFSTFTSLFNTFLSFLIPLLIISFVTVGLAELGQKANKLFGITLVIAYLSTIIAGFSAFLLGSAILPKFFSNINFTKVDGLSFDAYFTITAEPVFGVMTALILAFLLGLGLANTEGEALLNGIRDLLEIIKLVLDKIIIPLIPIYITSMFVNIAAKGELVSIIKVFSRLFLLILLYQWLYITLQFVVASIVCKNNKLKTIKTILPAYLTALGTQSSASTIPISLECAKKNGVSDDIAGFVIPLGATIHLAGDTICLVLGSMGILLASGMEPTLTSFIPFIFMLGVTMIAAPGIPGGGVMAALGLVSSLLGFTVPMQQLLISLHLSQDSFGTACNIAGDQAISLLINHIESSRRLIIN